MNATQPTRVETPVFVLGAGATKACGGPLTDEILPAALNGRMEHDERTSPVQDREELLSLTSSFLAECFNVPLGRGPIRKEDCPPLPWLLSMLRRSINQGRPIGNWQGERLVKARRAIEYAMFAVIEAALQRMPRGRQLHHDLLEPLFQRGIQPVVVSLNYDVCVDNAMFALADQYRPPCVPDYHVDIATPQYTQFRQLGTFGELLKIHGSLNWLYCKRCKRLDVFVSCGLHGLRTAKALDELYYFAPAKDAYSCRGTPCRNRPQCKGWVSPILVTPTYYKDYENPHIAKVWSEAERAMQQASRAVIIGYSLPTDDVDVAGLLQRGLSHLPRDRITVVEYVRSGLRKPAGQRTALEQHPTGQRFRSLLGAGLDWHTIGFEGWLDEQRAASRFPFSD